MTKYSKRPEVRVRVNAWLRNQKAKLRATSPKYRLNVAFSERIRDALKNRKGGRKWEAIVGYSLDDLMRHLERQFKDGMNWDNYGKWHIDHIIPISAFNYENDTDIDFKRCWDISNLRPLWGCENSSKKDKLYEQFQPCLRLSVGG